jgi:hypothetical protein
LGPCGGARRDGVRRCFGRRYPGQVEGFRDSEIRSSRLGAGSSLLWPLPGAVSLGRTPVHWTRRAPTRCRPRPSSDASGSSARP